MHILTPVRMAVATFLQSISTKVTLPSWYLNFTTYLPCMDLQSDPLPTALRSPAKVFTGNYSVISVFLFLLYGVRLLRTNVLLSRTGENYLRTIINNSFSNYNVSPSY